MSSSSSSSQHHHHHRYLDSGGNRGSSSSNNKSNSNNNNPPYQLQNVGMSHHHQHQQQQQHRKVDKYERFEAWLRDNGAKFEQLELREYDCGKSTLSSSSCSGSNNATTAGAGACEEKKETTGILGEDEEDEQDDEGMLLDRFSSSTNLQDHHQHEQEEEESEMRGVHARTHIPPHTICMTIPRRCLITVEMGQATPIGQAILNSDLDLDAPKHIFLMIYVLWDRKINGRDSFFDPYYQILPQTLSNMPIFWTSTELRALQGSYLLHQIADRNCAIAEDYQAICSIAPHFDQICTLDEFKWARMCVCSRNFGLQMDGHRTSALVPHADMLNHYRPRETKWTFDEDLQSFTITSLQHICPGSQVYDSYGQKCNHRFLLNYGFAVEDNRELDGFCPNEVPLELYVDPEDALFYEKLEFWTRGETSQSSSSAVAAMAAMHATKTMTASFLASHITSNNQYQQQQQHPYNHQHHNHHHESIDNVMAQPPVVKRVRVCVSNNENTRLLFSLLRALACNAQELRAIRGGGGSGGITLSLTLAKSNDNNSSSFFQQPASTSSAIGALAAEADHFRQYHNSSLTAASSFPLSLSSSPPSSSPLTSTSSAPYHRSCRDIRHPISIRNERAAMRLLLEIIGRHLSAYPTSLSQDVADLMDEEAFPRFSNLRHAKIQVRGEKQVLHHFALWARTALDVLDVIEEELKEERGSVEVKLTRNGRTVTEERPGFDYIIRRMEDDCDREHNSNYGLNHHQQHNNEHININIHTIGGPGGNSGPPIHHTILRYCADVLGSLRREETKNIKRQRAAAMSHHHHHQQQHQQNHHQQHYHPHGGSPYRSNSAGSSAVGGSGQHSNSNTMGQGSHGNMQSTSPQQQQQYRNYPHYNAASNSNGARGQPQQQQSPEHHHHSHSGASPGDRGGSNRPYSGDSPSSGYM